MVVATSPERTAAERSTQKTLSRTSASTLCATALCLERLERRTWFEAEVFGQSRASSLVDLERVALAA